MRKEEEEVFDKDKIQYGTGIISYVIIRSKKHKRIKVSEIIVDADNKITVRTPLDKDIPDIRKLVLGKASWILKKQKQHKEMVPNTRT